MESSFPASFDPQRFNPLKLAQPAASGNPLTQLYQHLLAQNQLIGASCQRCQHTHFPPKTRCPRCHGAQLEPIFLSGNGQLYSAEVSPNPEELSLGHILLEEGFWVRALLVGAYERPKQLASIAQTSPVDVVSCVLRTQGLSILAFQIA